MTQSSARQRNGFSEGFALGLLLNGRGGLPPNTVSAELAFRRAWRNWSHGGHFPRIGSDVKLRLNEYRIITHASEARQVFTLYWAQVDGLWTVNSKGAPIDVGNPDDVQFVVSIVNERVPAEAWAELAHAFLKRAEA
ncbi:hypothetical protein [Brevibacterium casei]